MNRNLVYTLLLISLSAVLAVEDDQIMKLRCSQDDITEFMNSNLSPACRNGLTTLQYQGDHQDKNEPFIPSASDLNTVCQQNCGGAYTLWLRDSCADPYRARMVETTCVFTAETTDIGERCRYSFPDAINDLDSYFNGVFQCDLGASSHTCPSECPAPMNALIDLLGCCYNSVYNNTEFIQYLQNIGLINGTIASSIHFLGQVSEWELCEIRVPPMCETITYRPISSAPSYPCFRISNLVMLAMVILYVLNNIMHY